MAETCPTCGQAVEVVTGSGEGTSHYAPAVTDEMVDRAVAAFWAQDLYEHSAEETRNAMRDALTAAVSPRKQRRDAP